MDPDRSSISTSRSFRTHDTSASEKASVHGVPRHSFEQQQDLSLYQTVEPAVVYHNIDTVQQETIPDTLGYNHHTSDTTQHPHTTDTNTDTATATAQQTVNDPPPFSSHNFPSRYYPTHDTLECIHDYPIHQDTLEDTAECNQESAPSFEESQASSSSAHPTVVAETKAALPRDTKLADPSKDLDDGEPPPPYTEGDSPLDAFTYIMATAGGAASIITQVQQGAPTPINTLAAVSDEHISLDLRGMRFTLSRDELLTLPEFVLLSLFPNGLLPDGHMNAYHDSDVYPVDVSTTQYSPPSFPSPPRLLTQVTPPTTPLNALCTLLSNPMVYLSDMLYPSQYDPHSLQYMLDFFRRVAQTIPTESSPSEDRPSPFTADAIPIEPMPGNARDMLQDRAGIIVLREDLDFYAIPPRRDIDAAEMIEVKRAAGRALLKQDGIFSGLRKSEEPGTTEQHLIEMLTAGYVFSIHSIIITLLTALQRLQPRRSMGSPCWRAQQGCHLLHRSGPPSHCRPS